MNHKYISVVCTKIRLYNAYDLFIYSFLFNYKIDVISDNNSSKSCNIDINIYKKKQLTIKMIFFFNYFKIYQESNQTLSKQG